VQESIEYACVVPTMDMTRSTQLVILIKNIYTLYGRILFIYSIFYILSNEYNIPFYSMSLKLLIESDTKISRCWKVCNKIL